MKKLIKKELDSIFKEINQIVKPKKIILFGSYANGNYEKGSDFDICIITDEERHQLDIAIDVRKALIKVTDKPLDILVYKSQDFQERASFTFSFERAILKKGVALHE